MKSSLFLSAFKLEIKKTILKFVTFTSILKRNIKIIFLIIIVSIKI